MQMKFLRVIIPLCLLLSNYALSQKSPYEFGDINNEDLQMSVYKHDSSASAVVLLDFGNGSFNYRQGNIRLEYHLRLKILKSEGFEYADVEIPLSAGQKVSKLKGVTYNLENGEITVTKLKKEDIFEEKVTKTNSIMKFTFPNVVVGSIIEYSYTIDIGSWTDLLPWSFQMDIPVRRSEFVIRIPNYFAYNIFTYGYEPIDTYNRDEVTEAGGIYSTVHKWICYNVPALKVEPYMPEKDHFISRIEFELQSINIPGSLSRTYLTTWEKFTEDLLEEDDYEEVMGGNSYLSEPVKIATYGISEPVEKMIAIQNYVKNTRKWNGDNGYFLTVNLRQAFREEEGSSADINLLLIAMLREAGLDAAPLLLCTRDHGIIRDFTRPFVKYFNYVIAHVKIGGKEYLLDATEPFLPHTILPFRCMNDKGRLIRTSDSRWVNLTVNENNQIRTVYNVEIGDGGTITANVQIVSQGYEAFDKRKSLLSDGKEEYIDMLEERQDNWDLKHHKFSNIENEDLALSENYEITIENAAEILGDILFFNPMMGEGESDNPFKLEERKFPIDFGYPRSINYVLVLKCPDDWQVDQMPQNQRLILPDKKAEFTYSVLVNEQVIQVMSDLKINKPLYNQTEYLELKNWYSLVVKKHTEQIVLKKISL